jgi:hypothetical protein
MKSTDKTFFEKIKATNPTKIIHRVTTSISPRVPHTITITTAPTATNPTPRPVTASAPPPYPTNPRGKTVS